MEEVRHSKPSLLSIEPPTSVKRLRSQNPHEPIDRLHVSSDRTFNVKFAREVSKWPFIKMIGLWCTTTKAALRQLLTTSGLEDVYISSLHNHGSLKGMPRPTSLHTFSCGWLSNTDLLHIAEMRNLITLSAQNSQLSNAVIVKLIAIKNLTNLDLEASNFNDEMAATLATSKSISSLNIGATRIGPRGLQSICQMTQLRELDIWALDIQESDLDMLAALTNLENLSVGGYYDQAVLTAKGVLPRIAQLPSLKRLWLDGIPLTEDQVAELKERYEWVQGMFA